MIERIYIPTAKRANNQITYNNLPDELKKRVIMVLREDDRLLYKYDCEYLVVPKEMVGSYTELAQTRELIHKHAGAIKYAMVDDDILIKRRNAKYWTGQSNMEKSQRLATAEEISEMYNVVDKWLDEPDIGVVGLADTISPPGNKPYRDTTNVNTYVFYDGRMISKVIDDMDISSVRVAEDMLFLFEALSRGINSRKSEEFMFDNRSQVDKDLQDSRIVWKGMFEDKDTPEDYFQTEEHYNCMRYIQKKYPHGVKIYEKDGKLKNTKYWRKVYKSKLEAKKEFEKKPENLENLSTQHARTRLRVKEFKEMNVKDLVVNPNNWRIHDETQRGAIRSAFDNVGFAGSIIAYESERNNNSIVVIDGHMRIDEIEGDIVPVLLLDVNDEEADILLATYDPLGSMATSDTNMLRDLLDNINSQDNESIKELMNTVDDYYVDLDTVPEEVKQYTQKIETPVYEMKGEYPVTSELYDNGKAERLIAEINNAQLPDDIKKFLILSAYRHTVFDFANIAEFYSHANAEVQDLMERSALVIIDIDKAVHNGYVQISEEFNKYFGEELDED